MNWNAVMVGIGVVGFLVWMLAGIFEITFWGLSFEGLAIGGLMLVMAATGLVWGYLALRRKRLMENTPTSKCQGVTIGLNELKGRAVSDTPLTSYLAEEPVVIYRYRIEEQVRSGRSGRRRTHWRVVESGGDQQVFELYDDTGQITIDPEGAEVEAGTIYSEKVDRDNPLYYGRGPSEELSNSTGRRRLVEEAVPHGSEIYVLGSVQLPEEGWEPEIGHDPMDQDYVISTESEKNLTIDHGVLAGVCYFGALALGAVLLPLTYVAGNGLGMREAFLAMTPWSIMTPVAVLMVVAVMYLKTIYDGLVDLRHRVDRAWAMLEVEWKRRHDLIPNLVQCVSVFSAHEEAVLEKVVEERMPDASGEMPRSPDEMSSLVDGQSVALKQLYAVIEEYPDLKSDAQFQRLMEELTQCEERIALAHSFYNESVEALNNRVASVPDMLIAPIAKAREADTLTFDEFAKSASDKVATPASV